ncbi:MAG TPA: DUF1801 domain-containing protein [Ohtaekwangia sp.]
MAKKVNLNTEVTVFLDEQKHPLRQEIEKLRSVILSAHTELMENIKWNGPNYCAADQDRITMKIQPPKQIQLIFHRGAKVQKQPKDKLIKDESGLLIWKENDRAVAAFKTDKEIESNKTALIKIVKDWISAAS